LQAHCLHSIAQALEANGQLEAAISRRESGRILFESMNLRHWGRAVVTDPIRD
jgi:hypothetical protein